MKALITGGAGFIGSHLAEFLLNEGHQVFIIDDLSGGDIANIPAGVSFIEMSILEYERLSGIFENEQFDYVYHLAAYAAESLSHYIRRFNYENNLIGSINLINLSIKNKIKCFIFTSSVAVYGHNTPPLKESDPLQPTDPYGIAKLAVELDLKSAYRNFGLNSVVFRPHNVFGPHQNISDKYRNVIGIFLHQSLLNKPMSIFGDGEQTRAFTYIDDIIPIIAKSAFINTAYNTTFNLGSETEVSINTVSELVAELMNIPLNRNYLKERNETKHNFASHDLVRKHFEIRDYTGLREGMRMMIEWVNLNHTHLRTLSSRNVEISSGLPEGW